MTIDPTEPPRIDDQAPKGMLELVHVTRDDGPDDSAMHRMTARLAKAGALPSAGANDRVEPRFAAYKLGVVALAVVGGLVVAWRATETTSTNAPIASAPVSSPDRGATEPPLAAEQLPSSAAADGTGTVAVSVDALPSVAPSSTGARATTNGTAGTNGRPPPANAATLASELELLQRAQTALASDPQRALSITGEQARAYPSGEFIQEREVIAVEALSRLGRKDESWHRARALVSRFPRTPYVDRLEIAVGRPL